GGWLMRCCLPFEPGHRASDTLSRVGMAPQRGEGAIELFGEHGPRQFVRPCHRREGQQQIGMSGPAARQAVGASYDEHQVAPFLLSTRYERGETRRVRLPPPGIQKNLTCGCMPSPRLIAIRPQLPHLDWTKARQPGEVVFGQSVGMRIPWFPDVVNVNLQAAGISMFLALRQSRSRS